MSVLADVLAAARRGRGANAIAAELGIDAGVVDAALDHGERLGLVVRAESLIGCGSCASVPVVPGPAVPDPAAGAPAACRGCPLATGPGGRSAGRGHGGNVASRYPA